MMDCLLVVALCVSVDRIKIGFNEGEKLDIWDGKVPEWTIGGVDRIQVGIN